MIEKKTTTSPPQLNSHPAVTLTRATIQAIFDNELSMRAAALAYYALFSLFPLVLLIISAVGFVLRSPAWQQQIMNQIEGLLPTRGDVVGAVVQEVITARGATGLLGMLTLLWTASGFFGALEASINHIFSSEQKRSWWRRRGLGMLMVLIMAPLLLLATGLTSLSHLIVYLRFLPDVIIKLVKSGLDYTLTLLMIVLVFSALLHWVPRRRPGWSATLIGALVTAILWSGITSAFTWYLGSGFATYNLVYGPIAAMIALILWLYLTSFVILLGATFTAQIDCRRRT